MQITGYVLAEKAEPVTIDAGSTLTLTERETKRYWMSDEKNGFTISCAEVIAAKATCSATSSPGDEACSGAGSRKLSARGFNKILKGYLQL